MRTFSILVLTAVASASFAQVTMFNSVDVAGNAAMRANFLAAAGITTPEFLEDFESYTDGQNMNGVPLIGGATVTDTNANPSVFAQSASTFFGSSVPFGRGLALLENRTFVFQFAVPTMYVSMYDIDDQASDVTVFLTDNSSFTFNNLDSTAVSGASGEFLGFVSTGLAIDRIQYNSSGGDGEWGIDDLEYGAVPEPATMALLGLGAAALLRRRRAI